MANTSNSLTAVYDAAGAARQADLHLVDRGLSNLIFVGWPDDVIARHWSSVGTDGRGRVARVWPDMAAALDALHAV